MLLSFLPHRFLWNLCQNSRHASWVETWLFFFSGRFILFSMQTLCGNMLERSALCPGALLSLNISLKVRASRLTLGTGTSQIFENNIKHHFFFQCKMFLFWAFILYLRLLKPYRVRKPQYVVTKSHVWRLFTRASSLTPKRQIWRLEAGLTRTPNNLLLALRILLFGVVYAKI